MIQNECMYLRTNLAFLGTTVLGGHLSVMVHSHQGGALAGV